MRTFSIVITAAVVSGVATGGPIYGTYQCTGICVHGMNTIQHVKEQNVLTAIRGFPGFHNTITSGNFTEYENYMHDPARINRFSGVTLSRNDAENANVFLDIQFKGPNEFVKQVRTQINPSPMICNVNCKKDV
mmetsp:Transcript_1047/g.1693  ORF Transcript_1047/g.1693 Transcript_1047/m.1693 type:complete len:133 (-) Transcript_1047:118-516(-)